MRVILNAASGARPRHSIKDVTIAFAAHGAEPRITALRSGTATEELAREAVRDGEAVVVAAGGDGTVRAVATALAGTGAALGVIPLGTLNHFAKDAGIPTELDRAVQAIVGGHTIRMDAAEVNGRLFVNNSSLGLYPEIVMEREEHRRHGYGKWFSFVRGVIAAVRRFPFLKVQLQADGDAVLVSTPFVFVGNNEYLTQGVRLGTRARLDGGSLWAYYSRCTTRACIVRLALKALSGRLYREPDFAALGARELWIRTRRRHLSVALDGEVVALESPLHYRSLPRALRVLVPPPA